MGLRDHASADAGRYGHPLLRAVPLEIPRRAFVAAAEVDEVLALWSGLGYYRRARQLHSAAREVVSRHDGQVPSDPLALRALPGIGRYTSGAVASIAFGLPEPILDGNVRRVISRIEGIDACGLSKSAEEKMLWERASTWAMGPQPGDLNQALMELGATICSPTHPECPSCPVSQDCVARKQELVAEIPRRLERRATVKVRAGVAVVRRGDRYLLQRRDRGPLRGEWDLPSCELPGEDTATGSLQRYLLDRFDLDARLMVVERTVTHGILHRRLTLEIVVGSLRCGRTSGVEELCWVSRAGLRSMAISGATTKVLMALSSASGSRRAPVVPTGRPKSRGRTA
ncbi:MAG: NUDIX domain-containing protein [Acidobacteriota bacterium]|nr:NUDIX domain-containing protein [Acidobacteriota bacterium]